MRVSSFVRALGLSDEEDVKMMAVAFVLQPAGKEVPFLWLVDGVTVFVLVMF